MSVSSTSQLSQELKTRKRNLVGGLDGSLDSVIEKHRDGVSGQEKLLREVLTLQGKMPAHIKTT